MQHISDIVQPPYWTMQLPLSQCKNLFTFKKTTPMNTKRLLQLTLLLLCFFTNKVSAENINLGTSANFVLFSSNGAIKNTSSSHLTGNVGTNTGSSTGFGNVNGVMHDNDGATAQAASDLLTAYGQLNNAIPNFFPAPLLGNGATLIAGVYSISGEASLNLDLTLDAQNDPNAVFIFKIQGAFSTAANSEIKLINGAKACNVYWKVEGLVSMAAGTNMKGTIVANNSAINVYSNSKLEGRALSTAGAITFDGVLASTPIGCGSPYLSGPQAPSLLTTENYALFSTSGANANAGISTITGNVATNTGLTTGYDALLVTGEIHPIPDSFTAQCAADLLVVYNYLNTLPNDIELLYPAQFGHSLVLTPHTYILNAATALTDTLFLDAQNNANAVFVIKMNGAFSTSTYANVVLMNGAQAQNVYWKVEGAVEINNYSKIKGTIICNNGAISLNTGARIDGRVLTTTGGISASAVMVIIPNLSVATEIEYFQNKNSKTAVTFAPNPFTAYTIISIKDFEPSNAYRLIVYNCMGKEIVSQRIDDESTSINTSSFQSGIYLYKLLKNNNLVQSGKLISK